jgi:hypothetical protein
VKQSAEKSRARPAGRTRPAQQDRERAGNLEEADVISGAVEVGLGVVVLSDGGIRKVDCSMVEGRLLFEGDIELGTVGESDAIRRALAASVGEEHAAVIADLSRRWTGGRVPYEPLAESSPVKALAEAAMAEIEGRTVARFVPRAEGDDDYIVFEASAFCSSRVGRVGGAQVVHLSADASPGNAVHELCHVLGLWHEQSRSDRDQYVAIRWENVLNGYEHNFRQHLSDGDDVGAYDFGSVMHYPPTAFSKNGKPTLEPKVGNRAFGQRNGLSEGDRAAIDALYGAAPGPAPEGPQVTAEVGNGVQFRVSIEPQGVARVVTTDWPARDVIHWDLISTEGPAGAGPLVSWSYSVGRSANEGKLDYYFTITNLASELVTVEARFIRMNPAS